MLRQNKRIHKIGFKTKAKIVGKGRSEHYLIEIKSLNLKSYLELTHLLRGSRCGDSSVLVLASSSEVLIPVKTTFWLYLGGAVQADIQKLVSTLDVQCCFVDRRSESKAKQNSNNNKKKLLSNQSAE